MILKLFVYYIITIILTPILGIGQEQLKIGYEKIAIPQIAPSIAFLIVASIFPSLKTPLNTKFDKNTFISLLVALLIPFGLLAICFYGSYLVGHKFEQVNNVMTTLPLFMGGMIFGAFGEEIGWRGFLQPNIEKIYAIIPSAIIVGLFWGLWHIGNYQYGILYMIGFLLFTISASIILRLLLIITGNNLIISVLFHFSINVGFFIFYKSTLTESKTIIANGIVWALVAIVFLIFSNRKDKPHIVA